MRIALNGFGRIGKNFARALLGDPRALQGIELVAINMGKADVKQAAYEFKYDSLMGIFEGSVSQEDTVLTVHKRSITLLDQVDALQLPWKDLAIDWVVDVTGHYTHADKARDHLKAGAHAVLISAPAHQEDVAIVLGVNQEQFDKKKHTIVSLGSCTTNALLPLLSVVHKNFTIVHAQATAIHSYTNTQRLLDVDADVHDPRRSRAAALNIVPSTTGASQMVEKIIPDLKNKVSACSVRVPVPTVSLLDLTCLVEKTISRDNVHEVFTRAAHDRLKNILAVSHEPLVSSDYQGNPYSVTLDTQLTMCDGPLVKLYGWYDNEWGYSQRLKDFLLFVHQQ